VAVAHWVTLQIYEVLSSKKPYEGEQRPGLTPAQAVRLTRHHTNRLRHLQRWLGKPEPKKEAARTA